MKTSLDPPLALRVRTHDMPVLEVRVNFGVFAGRHATPAEIDDLAHALREEAGSFTIVAEERHEFADDIEAAVHQVVIEIAAEDAGPAPDALCERIVSAADAWATACIAARHTGLDEL